MSNGYTRQSSSTIVTSNTIQASDFNNEYNQLQSAFDATTGHTHGGGAGQGAPIPLTTAVSGILPVANGGTGVANNAASTITITGSYSLALTLTNTTAITFPTTGILATRAGSETLTNKTLTSPILTTPALGTPASGILTSCTGLPISTGVSGLGTGIATFLATPSSTNLLAALTSTTGTGSAVFDTSPTLVTPVLGVATATSLNKVTITAPASSATLTIADGKALTVSNTLTLTGTDSSSIAFGTGGTVVYTGVTSLASLTTASNLVTVGTITSGTWHGTAIASTYLVGTDIATVGTITSGTWHGTAVGAQYGGTGIDSSASTGIVRISAGTWSASTALPNNTTTNTQASNDSSTKVATTAFVNPAGSATQNGYQKFASGVIAQWGRVATGSGSSGTATFALTFPTAVFSVVITGDDTNTADRRSVVSSVSTTGFGWATSGNDSVLYFQAWGN